MSDIPNCAGDLFITISIALGGQMEAKTFKTKGKSETSPGNEHDKCDLGCNKTPQFT